MAAELFRDLGRASDANNNSLAGAKWYFYETGTLDPQAVYSDADLSTSLGAEVTADAGGLFVPIYINPALVYRAVLKNAAGTTIQDIDPANAGPLSAGDIVLTGGGTVQDVIDGDIGIAFQQADTGSVATDLSAKAAIRLDLNPDFGATGDPDDSADTAFAAAIPALKDRFPESGFRIGQSSLSVASGVYTVGTSGYLSNIGATKRDGWKITGAGQGNTFLWYDPDGLASDVWHYDNGATARNWGTVLADMTMSGGTTWQGADPATDVGTHASNINTYVNGEKFTGPGWESSHMRVRMRYRFLNTVIHWAGSNNADQTRFIMCEVEKCNNVNYIDNSQSLAISWVQSYFNGVLGNVVQYGTNSNGGGGNFVMAFGSIIYSTDTPSDAYVWHLVDAGPSASSASLCELEQRNELRDEYSKYAKLTNTSATGIIVRKVGGSILNTSSADKTIVEVAGYAVMKFIDVSFASQSTGKMKFEIIGTHRLGRNAHLHFAGNCNLPPTIHDDIIWTGGYGRLTIDDTCYISQVTDTVGQPKVIAIGCDILGTTRQNSTSNRVSRKFVTSPIVSDSCLTTTTGTQVLLPPRQRIKRLTAKIEAGSGTGSTMRVRMGDGDGAAGTIYASSTTAAQNAGHTIDITCDIATGTTTKTRTVTIWVDDGAGANPSASVVAGVLDASVEYAAF